MFSLVYINLYFFINGIGISLESMIPNAEIFIADIICAQCDVNLHVYIQTACI